MVETIIFPLENNSLSWAEIRAWEFITNMYK